MNTDQIIAFVIFAVVACWTPGPSNVLLTATGTSVGVIRGLPALFGISFGIGLMMFLVVFGLGKLILDNPRALEILKWLGVAFILLLAWKIGTSGRVEKGSEGKPVGFFGAAAFQWVNPKSWVVCSSAAATYLQAGTSEAIIQALSLGTIFFLVSLPCCFPWLAFGAVMQRFLKSDRALRLYNMSMGSLLVASLALIVV